MMKRFLAAIATSTMLTACGGPSTFEEFDEVTAVSMDGNTFTARSQISMFSEGLVLTQIGGVAGDVARGVQEGFEGPAADAETLRLQLHFDATDRLGNEASIYAGAIDFPMTDIKAANLPNLPGEMLLDLASNFEPGEDASVIYGACANEDATSMSRFCQQVALAAAAAI